MTNFFHTQPLEELCARSLEKIKHVTDAATSTEVVGTAHNQNAIRKSMNTLSEGKFLRHDAYEDLNRVISILAEELDRETRDFVPIFHGRNDPEEGAIGTVIHERVLTSRGEQVAQCLGNLHVLREMLLILGHRFAAERIVNRRFGT
ncbi:MAG: hypothetical protein ACSHXI_22000 [Hoeflea sp.]|uniref:hypothetical protein n=1 Tax=Hoeflea sp. TaxID=1940281 RepID=UPI003EF47C5B